MLWPLAVGANNYGEDRVGAPEEIMARWEYGSHDSNVFVDRQIDLGSILWRGTLADYEASSALPSGLVQVVEYMEVPDIKNQRAERSVLVKKWMNRLVPT